MPAETTVFVYTNNTRTTTVAATIGRCSRTRLSHQNGDHEHHPEPKRHTPFYP